MVKQEYFLGLQEFVNMGVSAQSIEILNSVGVGGNAVVTMPSLSDGSWSVKYFAMKCFLNPSDSSNKRRMESALNHMTVVNEQPKVIPKSKH